MLPFLEKKKVAGMVMSKRANGSSLELNSEVEAPESDMDPGLKAAAEDIIAAIEAKSPIDLAKAFKAAFEICESYPHYENEEGEAE